MMHRVSVYGMQIFCVGIDSPSAGFAPKITSLGS